MANFIYSAAVLQASKNQNRLKVSFRSKTCNSQFQISKIVDCRLKRIGDLNYSFDFGACGTFLFPEERIMFCFGGTHKSKCDWYGRHVLGTLNNFFPSYDGYAFRSQADSKYGHYRTSLANFKDSPLAVGGYSPNTNKAEIYDISTNSWTEVANYPYYDR